MDFSLRNTFLKTVYIVLLFSSLYISAQFPHYYLVSSLFLIALILYPLFRQMSQSEWTNRELMMLAILGSISVVGRIPFSAIPSLQPSTFIIIITGLTLGPQSGFVVGALTAIVSNLILGQGPWTAWQMFAWGIIGYYSGKLSNFKIDRNKYVLSLYGLITGFLFGWTMNMWVIMSMREALSLKSILVYYAASFPFDLAHGIGNVVFLLLFSESWIKIILRFKNKYGLFS